MAILTGPAPRGTKIQQRAIGHAGIARQLLRARGTEVEPPRGSDNALVVYARVNGGRWIADCPDPACNGAERVNADDPTFYCWSCYNASFAHRTARVIFPAAGMMRSIEAALLDRPHVDFMSWEPGTTIQELREGGPFHRSWTAPRTWTTGEIVTAAILNAHVRDNLLETAPAKVTTQGDLVYATAANTIARLAKGTARQQLAMNAGATAPEWVSSLQSLMTAQGDLVYASSANTPARLAKGTASQLLRMNSGATAPEWATVATPEWSKVSSGALASVTEIDCTSLSGYKRYRMRLQIHASSNNGGMGPITARVNSQTTANYTYIGVYGQNSAGPTLDPSTNTATSWGLTAGQTQSNVGTAERSGFIQLDLEHDTAGGTFKVGVQWRVTVYASSSSSNSLIAFGGGNFATAIASIDAIKVLFGQANSGYYLLEGSNS